LLFSTNFVTSNFNFLLHWPDRPRI